MVLENQRSFKRNSVNIVFIITDPGKIEILITLKDKKIRVNLIIN